MNKKTINRDVFRFKHFSRKGYALFAVIGKEVLVGVLSVATLTYAKADGISTLPLPDDSTFMRGENVVLDELQVNGSRVPLTQMQAAKMVAVITRDDIQRNPSTTVNDLLKQATGVDVRQRGGFGVQTDISINGGTFDQITILLNGVSISNPQTGHNAADFPVSIDDIERIEILEGGAARLFGTSAFSGAINIVTRNDKKSGVRLKAEAGSYGTIDGGATASIVCKNLRNQLSAGCLRTDGGADNSDVKKARAYYRGNVTTKIIDLNWQVGATMQNYGANTFYSAKYDNQFEETRRLITSVTGKIHRLPASLVIEPTAYWNRSYDHYQLIRGMEGAKAGENYHRLDVFGFSMNAHTSWALGKTAVGFDLKGENIVSTALGEPLDSADFKSIRGSERQYDKQAKRTSISLFLEHDIVLEKWTISAGILANKTTNKSQNSKNSSVSPGIDIAWRCDETTKLYFSLNNALRMPTYTDMYMNNVIQKGDPNLKPERNTTAKIGIKSLFGKNHDGNVEAQLFYSHGKEIIDWVKPLEESTRYESMNIGKLDNMGFSINAEYRMNDFSTRLGYAFINQHHSTEAPIYRSLYALEYLRHKFTAEIRHKIAGNLWATWQARWQQRMNGYHPYWKIDCQLTWQERSWSVYLKGDNLTNHHYYDLSDVKQPGLWIMAGAKIVLFPAS